MMVDTSAYTGSCEKPALVLGATGFLGSHIARQLCAAGRATRAMVRESSDTSCIDSLPLELCVGDVSNVQSLQQAMRGSGTVFYCVVDTRAWLSDPTPLYRTNVEGLRNALDAAQKEGVERFVFTSSMATIGRRHIGVADEGDTFNWWGEAPDYIRSRVKAEDLLLEYCRERAFPGIALCVANTYGPQDYQPTPHGQLLWSAARGKLPVALDCGAPTVDIRDAAEAALLAERGGRIGERYIIANDYVSQPELFGMAASCLQNRPPRRLHVRIAYFIATLSEIVAALTGRRDNKLKRDSIFLSEAFGPLDNRKAREELGWNPRPIEESVKDAVAWFSKRRRSGIAVASAAEA